MTTSVTRSIEIDAPVEEVFAYMSDPQRQTQALARALGRRVVVTDVQTSPDGVVTGWTWSTRFVLPIDYTARATRAEHVANQWIVNRHHTITKDTDTFTFESTGIGTRLTWRAELSAPIPLLEGVAIRMAAKGRSYGRQIEDSLVEVKRELESSPVRTVPAQEMSVAARARARMGSGLKRAAWAWAGVPSGVLGWISTRTVFPLTSGTSYQAVAEGLQLRADDEVLDVACGSGALLVQHAGHVRRVAGIDLSDVQINLARRKLGARIAAGTAEIVKGDAGALPWADESFTAVSCVSSFETFPEPEKVVSEMVRVLRPGGRVALNIGERVPPGTETHRVWDALWVWSEDDVRRMVRDAGFADVTITYARAWGNDPVSRFLVWFWRKLGNDMSELRLVSAVKK